MFFMDERNYIYIYTQIVLEVNANNIFYTGNIDEESCGKMSKYEKDICIDSTTEIKQTVL